MRFGDDTYLQTLLAAQKELTNDAHSWTKHFPEEALTQLIEKYKDANQIQAARLETRRCLEYLLQMRTLEYRRDQAKMRLRGMYLRRTAWLLLVLGVVFGFVYVDPFGWWPSAQGNNLLNMLLLTIIAGAIGSVLSRAVKLGRQPLSSGSQTEGSEPPLGIRALVSVGSIFIAQSIIGATSALILFLVLETGLIQIGGNSNLGPAGYALVGFLAGFSEPFFLGILDKVSGQANIASD